ncbi:MAG: ATP-binding protein [Roseateles sp.]
MLSTTDWSAHEGEALVLHGIAADGLTLRGQICRQEPDLALLLLTPVVRSFDDLRQHGLHMADLALHDATGDLLMLQQSAQTSRDDAQRLTDRLRQRNRQLQLMNELSMHGIAYFSQAGDLKHSNPLFQELLGWDQGLPIPCKVQDVETRLQDIAQAEAGQQLQLEQLADVSNEKRDPFILRTRDGRHLSLVYRCGDVGERVLFIRDRTRETQLDRMKSEFMSTAAHELRTPMTSIYGFSEILISRDMPPEKVRAIADTIHKHAAWMVSLIDEVLDLARIEARQGEDIHLSEVSPEELLSEALAAYCDAGQQARLDWTAPVGLPPITADRVKAKQAVGNVISNALKYSPDGGPVHVRCGVERKGNRDGLYVEVEDHGLGMTEEQLARVFERFYRADPSCNIPGSGLGMSLVQQIMKLHQGTITLSSELGRGTCARLWFPFA